MYVFALDDDFHAFHVHGDRWIDPDGRLLVDTKTIGPGDIITVKFVETTAGTSSAPDPHGRCHRR